MGSFRAVVIGAGTISQIHLRTLRECTRTELVAVADINQQRAESCAVAYRIKAYTDYRKMVMETRPDVVIITLPHYLHKEAAIWCAAQGCHVLMEKPMAMNVQECTEMIVAARRNNVVLVVGHMQHYFPANIQAKQIIESGRLGRLVMIHDRRHSDYFRPQRPDWFLHREQSGGGIVINLGSHSVDKIQWLTGGHIASVKADMTYYGERGNVEGSACLYLRTTGGVTATVSLCGYQNVFANETELFFTGGQLKIEGSHGLFISEHGQPYEKMDTSGLPDAFAAQWNDVLDAIELAKKIGISGEYSQTVAAVIETAYLSHATGVEQVVGAEVMVEKR